MSVITMVRTPRTDLNLQDVLLKIAQMDHDLTVTELENKSVTFYINTISLRCTSIKLKEKGYEVKIPTMATRRDFILFRDTVDVLIKELDAIAFLEDNDKKPINDAKKFFSNTWICNAMTTDYHVQTTFAFDNEETKIDCPIRPFFIGKRILDDLEITENTPIEVGRKKLIEQMRYSQYGVPLDLIATPISLFTKACENSGKQYHSTLYLQNGFGVISGADYFTLRPSRICDTNEKFRILRYDKLLKIAPSTWKRFDNKQFFTRDLSDEEFLDFWNKSKEYNIMKV